MTEAASKTQPERPSWDQYFMTITREVAERSTCLRAKVGAVIVRDRSILATGYNGSPAGLPHCTEVGCLIYESRTPDGEIEQNCYRTIHAEINAISQAARNGAAIRDADIYVTHTPCIHCLKVLINTGVRTVYYARPYKLHTVRAVAQGREHQAGRSSRRRTSHDICKARVRNLRDDRSHQGGQIPRFRRGAGELLRHPRRSAVLPRLLRVVRQASRDRTLLDANGHRAPALRRDAPRCPGDRQPSSSRGR